MATVGTHCILELYDCRIEVLDDVGFVHQAVVDAARASGCALLNHVSHKFEPQGVTVVGLLAESHLSIHTWPEYRYVAADMFTCGDRAKPEAACQVLIDRFGAARHDLRPIPRGVNVSPTARPAPLLAAGSGDAPE